MATTYNTSTGDSTDENSIDLNVAYWEQIFTSILIIIIAIAGILGNSMIVAAVALSKKLQTATNAFVTSLAVTDLVTSFFLIWFAVGTLGKTSWPIPGAYWLCQLTAFMIYSSVGTSLYTLAAIAVNRLIHIIRPELYSKIFTSWKLAILIAIPWILPSASSAILLLTGNGGVGYNPVYHDCADIDDHKGADVFKLAKIVIGLPLPTAAIVISYAWIYVYLKRHFKRQLRNLSDIPAKSTDTLRELPDEREPSSTYGFKIQDHHVGDPSPHFSESRRERIWRQQVEITKNLFVVVCVFFACFLPYFFVQLLPVTNVTGHIEFYVKITPFINSSVNFLIYGSKHPDFNLVLGYMIRRAYGDIPQPSRLLKYLLSRKV